MTTAQILSSLGRHKTIGVPSLLSLCIRRLTLSVHCTPYSRAQTNSAASHFSPDRIVCRLRGLLISPVPVYMCSTRWYWRCTCWYYRSCLSELFSGEPWADWECQRAYWPTAWVSRADISTWDFHNLHLSTFVCIWRPFSRGSNVWSIVAPDPALRRPYLSNAYFCIV